MRRADFKSPAKRYTVRLHFVEMDNIQPGIRVFDVRIQGKTVLRNFDIVEQAGGSNKALVKEFKGIKADGKIECEFIPKGSEPTESTSPILSGIEVVAEGK